MGKLKIERISEWNNKAREIGIYIDGEKVGTINDGETLDFDLQSGKHELIAKIDWCASQKLQIDLSENETKTIQLLGFKYGNIIIPIIGSTFLLYCLSKYAFNLDLNFLILITALAFLYPMYFITFGKNSYLRLNEQE